MDFLLECIGFPPETSLEQLAARVEREGEACPWRGPEGLHRRLVLADGLELRLDREEGQAHPNLWPFCNVQQRLRLLVEQLQPLPDSPFDVLVRGRANPPLPELQGEDLSWPLACALTDARRLPKRLPVGHVLAVSVAGFALDVSFVGPDEQGQRAQQGARFETLGGEHDPGGCLELSLCVGAVRHLVNPLSGAAFDLLECPAPGRPLVLFVSRWQLEADAWPTPRPGWRVEGSFAFSGRLAGGLQPVAPRARGHFG